MCGDWNIAHREADLKNWKANQKKAGFLPEERAWLTRVFDEAGYVDVVRAPAPGRRGPVLVVVLPRPGLRQRRRLAHRPARRHARAGRAGGHGGRGAGGEPRPAVVRPRAGDRRLRRVGPVRRIRVGQAAASPGHDPPDTP